MTSSHTSASGGSAGRRRALGRGPGAGPPSPVSPAAGSESLAEDDSSAGPRGLWCSAPSPSRTSAHNGGAGGDGEGTPADEPEHTRTRVGTEPGSEPEA